MPSFMDANWHLSAFLGALAGVGHTAVRRSGHTQDFLFVFLRSTSYYFWGKRTAIDVCACFFCFTTPTHQTKPNRLRLLQLLLLRRGNGWKENAWGPCLGQRPPLRRLAVSENTVQTVLFLSPSLPGPDFNSNNEKRRLRRK